MSSSTNKRFYWLKLPDDFFNRKDIKVIESQKNGPSYVLFYLKLLTESIEYSGDLRFNEMIPFDDEMLATITNTDIDIVRTAMKLFQNLGLIEVEEDKTIFMTEAPKMLGTETAAAKRVRKHRAIKQLEKQKTLHCNTDVTKRNGEIDIEIDIDKEIDNKTYAQNSLSVSDSSNDLFNQFWNSYPRKVGKDKVESWFKRNKSKINEEFINDLVEAINLQQTSKEWSDPKYIPYPLTWLNRGGWNDQLTYSNNPKNYKENVKQKWGDFLNG